MRILLLVYIHRITCGSNININRLINIHVRVRDIVYVDTVESLFGLLGQWICIKDSLFQDNEILSNHDMNGYF